MATKSDLDEILADYWERILRRMGVPVGAAPPPFKVVPQSQVDTEDQANAGGWSRDQGLILVGDEYLRNANVKDLAGFMVHEAAHAAVHIEGEQGHGAAKQIEPLANAIRFELTGTSGGTWQPSEEAKRLADLSPLELKVVTAALGTGNYSNKLLKQLESGVFTKEQLRTSLGIGDTSQPAAIPGLRGGQTGPEGLPGEVAATGGAGGTSDLYEGEPGSGDGEDGLTEEEKARRKHKRAQDRRAEKADARAILNSFGIPLTDNLQHLVAQAAKHDWNNALFMEALRKTDEYRKRFPGIMDGNGTTKMSEAEYIQAEKLYNSYASQAGINLGAKRLAFLFRNDVTPDEFNDRAEAQARLSKNKEFYSAFKRELVQGGVAKPSEVNTNKELFKFIMGEGNKSWADLWQDSITRYAANQAGIAISKNKERYTAIGQKALERISSQGLSEEESAQKFGALSELLSTVLPLQEADLYGVSKKTATAAIFGGKNSERARQKVKRAIETDEAFYQDRAGNAVYSDEQGGLVTQGVTDRRRKQQSEF